MSENLFENLKRIVNNNNLDMKNFISSDHDDILEEI